MKKQYFLDLLIIFLSCFLVFNVAEGVATNAGETGLPGDIGFPVGEKPPSKPGNDDDDDKKCICARCSGGKCKNYRTSNCPCTTDCADCMYNNDGACVHCQEGECSLYTPMSGTCSSNCSGCDKQYSCFACSNGRCTKKYYNYPCSDTCSSGSNKCADNKGRFYFTCSGNRCVTRTCNSTTCDDGCGSNEAGCRNDGDDDNRTPPPGETPSDGGGGCGNGGGNGGESGGGNGGESGGGNGGESGGGDSCGGACDCCPGDYHYEQERIEEEDGTVHIRNRKVCDSDRRCKQYTCHWKECSGCCCVSRSRTYTVDCGDSCPCPSSTCSSNCDCCGGKGSCYPRVFLNIDPPKLFVNQSFNLSYEAEGDSCCGGLRCTVTGTYQGFNCGQSGMIGICPSDAQGVNVCDPKNQLRSLTSSSGRATITTHSQYWGNCLYKVTCTNSCGNSSSATQTVMTVPVPLWGEESPISNLFSPLKPFISLFSL